MSTRSETDYGTPLQGLRRTGVSIPDDNLIDNSPLQAPEKSLLCHPFDKAVYDIARKAGPGSIIAVDLDDTLLVNSYMCADGWRANDPAPRLMPQKSISFKKMELSLRGRVKRVMGSPKRAQYDRRKYPFLAQPEINVQIRPGMLSALTGFRDAGTKLVLVSATAKRRMEFLLSRLPVLKKLFYDGDKLCIITAEDILRALTSIEKVPEDLSELSELDLLSLGAHKKRPMSLAVKTPYLVNRILSAGNYDILVDDSDVTYRVFKSCGLSDRLIKVSPGFPHTGYVMDIVNAVIDRLKKRQNDPGEIKLSPSGKRDFNFRNYPFVRFEDPLYYPMIHMKDRLPPEKAPRPVKVAVIIINRDRPALTDRVTEQIQKMGKGISKDIFVVECGSSKKGRSKYMTHRFRDAAYRGRYYGFNRGLEIAKKNGAYDYCWFCVNDIVFPEGEDTLAELVDVMEENPRMAVIAPGEPEAKDYPGCFPKAGRRWHKASTVHGLAFLMKKKALEEVGFCNPEFRYSQGAAPELAYKLYKKGWFLAYSDRVTLRHLGGSTYGVVTKISRHEYLRRSRNFALKYLAKHYGKDWDILFSKALPPDVEVNTFSWMKNVAWAKKLKKEPPFLVRKFRIAGSRLKQGLLKIKKQFRVKTGANTSYK